MRYGIHENHITSTTNVGKDIVNEHTRPHKKGLLGYQPIFFPNGVISGSGLQFFGNLRSMTQDSTRDTPSLDASLCQTSVNDGSPFGVKVNSFNFNRGQLGNLYVPNSTADSLDMNSEFYYCIADSDLFHFSRYNIVLLQMYNYFASQAIQIAKTNGVDILSMIEVGANTCFFPIAFGELGLSECHGTDIVDYSEVVDLLSEIHNTKITFHHMPDDSDDTWRKLPKADLAWSYAVLLHQSNPLAHLTKLASLAKKALFVMTLCDPEDWKSQDEMAIRYLSANSYYNADFPNCFDVSIVSPALLKYSLYRLGFSKIVEVPHPEFDLLDHSSQQDLKYWLNKHCFFIAFREDVKDKENLDDYCVSAERSPFRGDNVLVHSGHHNNIVLSNSRYYIVPHGTSFTGDAADIDFKSFSSLTNAMTHFLELSTELNPLPLLVKSLSKHNIVRYKSKYFLCPHGIDIDFSDQDKCSQISALDSLEDWEALLVSIGGEAGLLSLTGNVVAFLHNICITHVDGFYVATDLSTGHTYATVDSTSMVLSDLVKMISVKSLLHSMKTNQERGDTLYQDKHYMIVRQGFSNFSLHCSSTQDILSTHSTLEEAWCQLLGRTIPVKP